VPAPLRSTTPRRSGLGLGASALAALGWGFAGVFADLTVASGPVLTFWRCWIGAGLLVATVLAAGRRITWGLLRLAAPGGVLLAADMVLFFSAIKLTPVAVATVIGALQPALVMLAAGPLVGERVGRGTMLWTAVAIAGVAVIVLGAGAPSSGAGLGDLLAVGSLIAWAGYFVTAKRARPRVDALDYTAGVTLIAAVSTSLTLLIVRQSPGRVAAGDWVWIGLLAVLPGGAHLLMNWAHQHLDISVASLIGSANPIVAAVAAYVILGQRLNAIQVAGGVVGVAAISVVAVHAGRVVQSPAE
jgi:drug/metabolite transporter (DMT)-like permease